ncbi:MAG: hypothetical protein PSN34_05590 [Urechidicola sp.]|nr:hypothetical protein [Urechidicola sp.]
MVKSLITPLFIFLITMGFSQNLISEKFKLPKQVNETSGLLLLNGKIVTFNDSGNTAQLFELDTITGEISRTIDINNAKNVDWEDITQDDSYIYIADIGNNYGSRKNLMIYKISKDDFLNTDKVDAEIIELSYDNQTKFNSRKRNNFDAESLIALKDILVIFTKNRGNQHTSIYTLSKEIGPQTASYSHSYDVEGLMTGATLNKENNRIVMCGYADGLSPFLVILDNLNTDSFIRIDLAPLVGLANQIEGITYIKNEHYYLSREQVKKKIGGYSINVPPKLFSVDLNKIDLHQNEVNDFIKTITSSKKVESHQFDFKKIKIKNELEKTVFKRKDSFDLLSTSDFKKGNYSIQIKVNDTISVTSKFIVD